MSKDQQVRKVIDQKKLSILVEADGGIKADNIDRVVAPERSYRLGIRHF